MEELKNNPKPILEKGMMVKLREDLPREQKRNYAEYLDLNALYRVLAVGNVDGFGDVVWIGPTSMSQENVDDFSPELMVGPEDHRYDEVYAIITANVRTMHN